MLCPVAGVGMINRGIAKPWLIGKETLDNRSEFFPVAPEMFFIYNINEPVHRSAVNRIHIILGPLFTAFSGLYKKEYPPCPFRNIPIQNPIFHIRGEILKAFLLQILIAALTFCGSCTDQPFLFVQPILHAEGTT